MLRWRSSVPGILGTALILAGCTAATSPSPSSEASPSSAVVSVTASPIQAPTSAPTPGPTPTLPSTAGERLTESIDLTRFSAPSTVDNVWFPLAPGQRWTFAGAATIDGERLSRRVVLTVTDLTKDIGGVRTIVAYEVDYTDGVLDEAEIVFWAQDDDGVVWRIGEYPESYEDGKLAEAPIWIHGYEDAMAGIAMPAEPQPDTPSFAEGWGPAVDWTDRARVFEVGSRTCVQAGCYEDVLVIDEFNRDEPDAHQLKYYAKGVGNVRVGWAGALEEEKEVLELVKLEMLSSAQIARVDATTLAQDARGYRISPDVYGRTAPAMRPGG